MEGQISSWSSATNWIIDSGSLESSISFESSISPIEENIDSSVKDQHLLLKSPSPDSGPCEIKSKFKFLRFCCSKSSLNASNILRTVESGWAKEEEGNPTYLFVFHVPPPSFPLCDRGEQGTLCHCNLEVDYEERPSMPYLYEMMDSTKEKIVFVYVRSTARVYEIYYAPDKQSSNEYLCTVRCSMAAKEDPILHTSDIGEEAKAAPQKGCSEESEQLSEEKVKYDTNNGTTEDDWVEVKAPDSPLLDNRTSSLPKKFDGNIHKNIQDFYEATAEITDASPCVSLTLRLLSLPNKGCVHLEEIFIFADPVESTETDHRVGVIENPAGSSLMTMLVPLMQLSKPGISRMQDKHISDTRERQGYQDGVSNATESTNFLSTIQQDGESSIADRQEVVVQEVTAVTAEYHVADRQGVAMKEVTRVTVESTELKSRTQVPGTEHRPDSVAKENDLPYSRLERVLDQLLCRVGRIEAFCSRFEENMLKPLNSMETRLQRMEQQLEILTVRPESSGLYSCTRVATPEFSCNEYVSNSFYGNENDDHDCGGMESARKDTLFAKSSSPIDDVSVSGSAPQLFSRLVITAPEFSNGDDDDDDDNSDNDDDDDDDDDDKNCNDVSESTKIDCPTDKPKPSLSIDDALASALAKLLFSTSSQPTKLTQTLIIKAPDFPNDEDGSSEKFASPRAPCEKDLASAIAGFLSSTPSAPSNLTQTLAVKAPDFPNEEDGSSDKMASPRAPCERAVDNFTCITEKNGPESVQDSELDRKMHLMKLLNYGHIEEMEKEPIRQDQLHEQGTKDNPDTSINRQNQLREEGTKGIYPDTSINQTIAQDRHDILKADDHCITEETNNGEASNGVCAANHHDKECTEDSNPVSISNETVIQYQSLRNLTCEGHTGTGKETFTGNQFLIEQNDDRSPDSTPKGATRCADLATAEEAMNEGHKDVPQNTLEHTTSSVVDFELSLLDVKFVSQENWEARSPLEALLSDISETKTQTSCAKDEDDGVVSAKQIPRFLEDREPKVPTVDEHLLVEVDNLTMETVPSKVEGELQDPSACSNQEPFMSLI
ncbi:hypothetical protein HHK36_017322 [Tetracentron sinense]|uniref:Uncharacterized protein n=1 Tax=Tetracentron sinense TaxID=13715 RepID=A0A834Z2L0_TETSI|nr:hypothetical protein HHK36_017322 [Tetracentron sinense]